jgi:hypothetical protein
MEDAGLAKAMYWAPLLSTIADWAFGLTVVFLAAQLISGQIAKRFQKQIDAARELKIAELNNETAKLRKQIAPRMISREQRQRISQKMKQFAGQDYSGMVASDVGDAWDVWREVSLSLELANWHRLPPPGLAATQYGPPAGVAVAPQAGVMILFAGARWNELHSRAQALADAITAEGIAAGAAPATGVVESRPTALMIVVGPKPQ